MEMKHFYVITSAKLWRLGYTARPALANTLQEKKLIILKLRPSEENLKHRYAMHERVFLEGGWITWNIVSDVYILTKGKKSISVERNENVELTHRQIFCDRLYVLSE